MNSIKCITINALISNKYYLTRIFLLFYIELIKFYCEIREEESVHKQVKIFHADVTHVRTVEDL